MLIMIEQINKHSLKPFAIIDFRICLRIFIIIINNRPSDYSINNY